METGTKRKDWQTRIPDNADPKIRALFDYWNAKRGDAPFPDRCDIDPVEIPRLLEFVTLVEIRAGEPRFVYKVVGTNMSSLMVRDPTGKPVGTGVKRSELEAVLARYEFVATEGLPVFHTAYLQEDRNDFTQVQRLMLPLGPRSGKPTMILSLVTSVD